MKDYIGENIRKARIKKNMSQQDLAKALNVERSTISGWETGKRIPDVEKLGRICTVLDTPMLTLMVDGGQSTEKPLVIIVDDEKVILNYNASVVRQVMPKAEIMCFTKPSAAIDYANKHNIDLAFLDIEMGKTSGLDVCRELIRIRPETNVIYLTAYVDYSFDAWSTGASGFLLKPLNAGAVRTQLSLLKKTMKGYE